MTVDPGTTKPPLDENPHVVAVMCATPFAWIAMGPPLSAYTHVWGDDSSATAVALIHCGAKPKAARRTRALADDDLDGNQTLPL